MAKLTAAARKALPRSDFAVPSKAPGPGSYPIPDKAHADNAKSRAAEHGTPAVKAAVAAKTEAKGFSGKTPAKKTAAKKTAPKKGK